jgi:hypothetical protein
MELYHMNNYGKCDLCMQEIQAGTIMRVSLQRSRFQKM